MCTRCSGSSRGGTLNALKVTAEELEIILQLLCRHVPGREVRAFGSRVGGAPKTFSDLDLVIMGEASLPIAVRADLREAFIESALPFRVDLVDWATTDSRFRDIIMASSILLQAERGG